MSLSDLQRDFAVNTFSVFEAAKEAVAVFEQLPPTASRTFICTGNVLNEVPIMPAVGNGYENRVSYFTLVKLRLLTSYSFTPDIFPRSSIYSFRLQNNLN
jgi:hypothetical protein